MTAPSFGQGVLLGVLFSVLLAGLGGLAALWLGLVPFNADVPPSLTETALAGLGRDAFVRRSAPPGPNPVSLTDGHLLEGMRLYRTNCLTCHGDSTRRASSVMYPPVPEFPVRLSLRPGEVYWIARHGIRLSGMPAFGGMLSDDELWKVVLFVQHMPSLPATVDQAWRP